MSLLIAMAAFIVAAVAFTSYWERLPGRIVGVTAVLIAAAAMVGNVWFTHTYRCVRTVPVEVEDAHGRVHQGKECVWYVRRDGDTWTRFDTFAKRMWG